MSEGKGPTRDAQAESEKVTMPQGAECSPPEEPAGRTGTETGELPPVTLRARGGYLGEADSSPESGKSAGSKASKSRRR